MFIRGDQNSTKMSRDPKPTYEYINTIRSSTLSPFVAKKSQLSVSQGHEKTNKHYSSKSKNRPTPTISTTFLPAANPDISEHCSPSNLDSVGPVGYGNIVKVE